MLNLVIELMMDVHSFEPLYDNCVEMQQIGYHKLLSREEAEEVITQLDRTPCVNASPVDYQYTTEHYGNGCVEIKVYWPQNRSRDWGLEWKETSDD